MNYYNNTELYRHGVKGQKWGVRRYRNYDGTLTSIGKKHSKALNDAIFNRNKREEKIVDKIDSKIDKNIKKYGHFDAYEEWYDKNGNLTKNARRAQKDSDKTYKYGQKKMPEAKKKDLKDAQKNWGIVESNKEMHRMISDIKQSINEYNKNPSKNAKTQIDKKSIIL